MGLSGRQQVEPGAGGLWNGGGCQTNMGRWSRPLPESGWDTWDACVSVVAARGLSEVCSC